MNDKPGRITELTLKPAPGKLSRRRLLTTSAAALAGSALLGRARVALPEEADTTKPRSAGAPATSNSPQVGGADYTPVIVPNGWTLPFTIVDGWKVFHLVAEEVHHEFTPGIRANCWGYNGSVHGPLIEAVEGDQVRIFVTNKLAAPTTVHWHGILLPNGMDGVGGLSQRSIRTGETFMYEFALKQHGTFMYHSHHDEMTQMGMGMVGLFVIHPRDPKGVTVDRDFALLLHEWSIEVGTERPNPNEMTDFNILTINGRCFPGTEPLVAKLGERIRIRIGNLSAMDHHPIHLHGYYFKVTETDGGRIPEEGQWPETTVLVPVGSTRTIEFVADNPGDWAMHCHMTHHVMNQMGHEFPNMIGVAADAVDEKVRKLLPDYMTMGKDGMGEMAEHIDAGHMKVPENSIPMLGGKGPHDYITMGGMFTILKVREVLTSYEDPGWYKDPAGTLASLASEESLKRNGIKSDGSSATRKRPLERRARHLKPGGGNSKNQAANSGAIYTCPMHGEVRSSVPGACPKCGMKLKKVG